MRSPGRAPKNAPAAPITKQQPTVTGPAFVPPPRVRSVRVSALQDHGGPGLTPLALRLLGRAGAGSLDRVGALGSGAGVAGQDALHQLPPCGAEGNEEHPDAQHVEEAEALQLIDG